MNISRKESGETLRVTSVRTLEGLDRLRPEWRALYEASGNKNPFASDVWIGNWFTRFGSNQFDGYEQYPHILTFRSEDRLVGITPLVRQSKGPDRAGLHRLRMAGATPIFNMTETPGSVVAPEWENQHAQALADRIEKERSRFLKIYMTGIEQGSPISKAFINRGEGWSSGDHFEVFVLGLRRGFDQVLLSASGSLRRHLKKSNEALEGHDVQFRLVKEPGELPKALDTFFALHTARAVTTEVERQTAEGEEVKKEIKPHNDYLPTPEHRLFLKNVAEELAPRGKFMVSSLRIDGIEAASLILILAGRRAYRYYSGFDPKYYDKGVMLNLTARTFDALTQTGDLDEVNLSAGRDRTKTSWKPEAVTIEFHGIEASGVLGSAVKAAREANRNAREIQKALRIRERLKAIRSGNFH